MKASNAEKQIIQKLISKSPEEEEGMCSRDSAAAQRRFFCILFSAFPTSSFFKSNLLTELDLNVNSLWDNFFCDKFITYQKYLSLLYRLWLILK